MPATITHALFAQDVLSSLEQNVKATLSDEEKSFIMFSQSTDPIMFYNIMSLRKGKDIRSLQYTYHIDKSIDFFSPLIDYIKKNKLYNESMVLSFLYGFITHYCLDSNVHPYVYYKTGNFDKRDKTTYKYNCEHHMMETYIDNYMLKKKKLTNFNIYKECYDIKTFTNELKDAINYIFYKTYSIPDFDRIYHKSLKDMRLFIKLFRTDNYGIKKGLYKLIDKVTPESFFILESLSYHNYNDKHNYLNKNHCTWKHPWNYKESKKDFDELYNDSLQQAINIIECLHNYFFKNEKTDIETLFNLNNHLGIIDKTKPIFEF